jgi:uncharacterized protein (DUF58 family)
MLMTRIFSGTKFAVTTPGWFFFLTIVLIMGAAASSGHNLLYLGVCLLFGVFITMGNVAVLNLKKLQVNRSIPDYPYAGRPYPIEITVRNNRRFMDSFSLQVNEVTQHAPVSSGTRPTGWKVFIPLVIKGHHNNRQYEMVFPERGWFQWEGVEIITRFPFGFWERSRYQSLNAQVLVYPRLFDHWPEAKAMLAGEGELTGKKIGMGDDLLTFRDFLPGDSIRRIHWKNSAKNDRLTVAVYNQSENAQVIISLQTEYSKSPEPINASHFEEAISWAATATCILLERGVAVGYIDERMRIPPSIGEGHRHQILSHMALLKIMSGNTGSLPEVPLYHSMRESMIRIVATPTGVDIHTSGERPE